MAKSAIPVYDIRTIDHQTAQKDLLLERFGPYLQKHYQHLQRPHRHSFYHLVMFTQGDGTHDIDFVRFPVKAFQLYFMRPGQVHSWHFEGEADGYIIHFNETLFSSFLRQEHYPDQFPFFKGDAENSICQLPLLQQETVVNLFESMLLEADQKKDRNLDMIRILLMELFITVDRSCAYRPVQHIPPQKLLVLRNFQQLIDQHFRLIRLPKEYAALLYITPNHLNALCQDLLGKTAGDLIRDRVLLEARRMLTNLDMSVAEIAYDLNFQDNSYFNRFFKKNAGVTPDEFRQNFVNQ